MRSPLILISPFAAVAFSLAAAAASLLFPPAAYREMIEEGNYIFLNPRVIAFVSLCVAAFGAGYAMFHLARRRPLPQRPSLARRSPVAPIRTELLLGWILLAANAIILLLFIRAVSLGALFAALIGETRSAPMRQTLAALLDQSNLGSFTIVTRAIVPWLAWLYLRRTAGDARRRSLGLLLFPLITLHLSIELLIGGRAGVLLVIFALMLVWALDRWSRNRLRWKSSMLIGGAAAVFALVLFGVVSNSRKGLSPDQWEIAQVVQDATAYYVGSYNRFAAMIEGALRLPGSGGGYYWTSWFWEFPVLENLLGIHDIANYVYTRQPVSGWFGISPHIRSIGFNRTYTALTIFSYTFADFGWAGFLAFVPYGFLAAYCWRSFTAGRMVGVIAYPIVLWSLLEWRGHIEIARPGNDYVLLTLLFLGLGHAVERSLGTGPRRVRELKPAAPAPERTNKPGPSHA